MSTVQAPLLRLIPALLPPHACPPAETETTTFTDCVNCLIAFTNNPHSLDVSLNAIAFLRFCALALAEGDIGELEGALPVGGMSHLMLEGSGGRLMDPNSFRIRCEGAPPREWRGCRGVGEGCAGGAAQLEMKARLPSSR